MNRRAVEVCDKMREVVGTLPHHMLNEFEDSIVNLFTDERAARYGRYFRGLRRVLRPGAQITLRRGAFGRGPDSAEGMEMGLWRVVKYMKSLGQVEITRRGKLPYGGRERPYVFTHYVVDVYHNSKGVLNMQEWEKECLLRRGSS